MNDRRHIQLCGTGSYLPEEVLDNQHFANYLDTSDEWIVTRTGIRERRRAAADQATSDLATEAAKRALDDAKMGHDDIDVIICATATPDHFFPSTASLIHANLGATRAAAFDISAACAGFLHATTVAVGLLASGIHRTALVIGAETLTRFADPEDRTVVVLLGDAAGAAVLSRPNSADFETSAEILFCELGCDGTRAKDIWLPGGGSRLPQSHMVIDERLPFMKMRGREVYKFAVLKLQELIDRALEQTGLTPNDLKLVIPHQSNLRIIESARERLGLPPEKVTINIDRYGNTSAASVIVGLDEARRAGKLKPGDHVLMIAIGAGIVWGVMVVRL
jgi:3-oxoacyl-[acyl-carrier-protein] synthase III